VAYAENKAFAKQVKADHRATVAANKAAKQAAKIERAKARLEKLLSKQVGAVGTKAKRAAKRPSKAVITKGEPVAA
jgi:hypothetical protein